MLWRCQWEKTECHTMCLLLHIHIAFSLELNRQIQRTSPFKSHNTITQCWRISISLSANECATAIHFNNVWFDRMKHEQCSTEVGSVCVRVCAFHRVFNTSFVKCKFHNWRFVVDKCWKLNRLRSRLTLARECIIRWISVRRVAR